MKKTGPWPVFLYLRFGFAAATKTVITPDALHLVTLPISGAAEAVKISLNPLNGADNIRFSHTAGFDTSLLGEAADSLDMHGVPHFVVCLKQRT
jgi:hypothetical protein